MLKIFDLVEAVADSRTTVLMTGESGTGKSLIARAIHHRSPRRRQAVCRSILRVDSRNACWNRELFGHVKGSFTGATYDKQGRFLAADGGTIFLDEINSASPAFQVKLLRVLQERKFEPVGCNHDDQRGCAGGSRDAIRIWPSWWSRDQFRQDLYYRINVVNIMLPPLRQRLGDIPLLAEAFLKKLTAEMNRKVAGFHARRDGRDARYTWPGNVRELENAIERAVVLTKRPLITPEDLPQQILDAVQAAGGGRRAPGAAACRRAANPFEPWIADALKQGDRRRRRSRFCSRH